MRTAILKYALGAVLCGVLAFGAAAGFGEVGTAPVGASEVAQFCVPSLDNPDAHRFYCRNEDGWSGPTGRAAFACAMQGMAAGVSFAVDSPRVWSNRGGRRRGIVLSLLNNAHSGAAVAARRRSSGLDDAQRSRRRFSGSAL